MQPSRGMIRIIAVMLIFWAHAIVVSADTDDSSDGPECVLTKQCQRCTETDRKEEETCSITGKIQEFTCTSVDDNGKSFNEKLLSRFRG